MSIKPQYANLIVDGAKTVELRRRFSDQEGARVLVYATGSLGLVIGEFYIKKVVKAPVDKIWHDHGFNSIIPQNVFDAYFSGKSEGYAIVVTRQLRYETPIPLKELDKNIKRAPQSYMFLG